MASKIDVELVSLEGEDIVIRITPDALKFATEQGPALEEWNDDTGALRKVEVTDIAVWRAELISALRHEQENGDTPVHLLLDAAVRAAVEDGAEGIAIEGVLP